MKLCLLFIFLSMNENADVDLVCRCPEFFDPVGVEQRDLKFHSSETHFSNILFLL